MTYLIWKSPVIFILSSKFSAFAVYLTSSAMFFPHQLQTSVRPESMIPLHPQARKALRPARKNTSTKTPGFPWLSMEV